MHGYPQFSFWIVITLFSHRQKLCENTFVLVGKFLKKPKYLVGGDRGSGDREKRGREVYGRREKRGREAGFPRWREAGEKGENYATLRNVSQSKKCKGAGAKKYRAGTGSKGCGKREV